MLTRYLEDTLGGNSNTVIICTVSKLKNNTTHTKMTLDFGLLAQKIKTKPVMQVEYSISELTKMIKKLEKENTTLKTKITGLLKRINIEGDVQIPEDIPQFDDISQVDCDGENAILESSNIDCELIDQTLNQDLDELEMHLNTNSSHDSNYYEELKSCQGELKDIHNKNIDLNTQIVALQSSLNENEQKLVALQTEFQSRIQEISCKDAEIETISKEKEQALERMKVLQDQTFTLNEQAENYEYESKNFKTEIEKVTEELK